LSETLINSFTQSALVNNPHFWLVALPAITLFGLGKGGFSGVGILAIPLFALVISPLQAAVILLPLLLAQDALTIYSYRDSFDKVALKLMLPASFIGLFMGYITAQWLNVDMLKIMISFIAVVFCLYHWFGKNKNDDAPQQHEPLKAHFWGAMSGFTSFMLHAGGTPFNVYLLPKKLPKLVYAGTAGIFFGVVNLTKIPAFAALNIYSWENFLISLILVPWALLTNFLGIWLVRRVSEQKFRAIIYMLTFLVGLKLLWDGVRSFM
jgi:uncharacterized protein